jgi:ketosteroid isomerase-like protein
MKSNMKTALLLLQGFVFGLAILPVATVAQNNGKETNAMNKLIVSKFVAAINEHNVDKICSLMADEHKFIDSHGHEVAGKDKMKTAWTGYFEWFPDYKIEVTDVFADRDTVGAFGFASGTFHGPKAPKENYWRLPASWKATLKDGKVQLWQVYADSKIPFDIINKSKGA